MIRVNCILKVELAVAFSATCQIGEGAAVPSLGLSNKAVTMADLQEESQVKAEGREEVQAYFKPLSLRG